MRTGNRILLITLIMSMMMISFVSAFEFDNVKFKQDKTFDGKNIEDNRLLQEYKPIKIVNGFGLGRTLMEGYLSEHTEVCSNDCESIMQIKLGKDTPLVDNVSFLTLQEDGEWIEQSVRDYQFYFKSASSDSDWDKYTLGQIVSAGDYEVKLDGDKKPSRTVDWIIKTNGEILDSWAVWGNS